MIQKSYPFPIVVSGNTQEEVSLEILVNEEPIDLTDYTIKLNWLNPNGTILKSLTTANDSIIITDAVNGKFKIPKWLCDMPSSKYISDIKFISPSNEPKSYIKVFQEVIPRYTE